MGSNVMAVFLDEFLFMNPKAFPSIFPTTATGALLVMTSSMSPNGASTAMKLIDVKNDDGTDVVTKYNWVQACNDCRRKGIPEKCNHFVAEPQHFQNYASQSRLAKLMSGIEGAYEREMQNICDEPTIKPLFTAAEIDDMVKNHARFNADARHLVVSIDPSGGKHGNYYVACSMVFSPHDGMCTVVGAEMCNSASSVVVAKTLVAHVAACRAEIPELRSAKVVVIPESNMPGALDLMHQCCTVLGQDWLFMTEDTDRSAAIQYDMPGSTTTRQNKPHMIRLLAQRLAQRRIVFHTDFVVAQQGARNIQKEFISELRSFSQILVVRDGPEGAPQLRTYYSGKAAGGNDDFVMALALGGYMKEVFEAKEKYAAFR